MSGDIVLGSISAEKEKKRMENPGVVQNSVVSG
jgi:hypothetical protein